MNRSKQSTNSNRASGRNRHGYALVSVMMISLVASMFLMSLAGLSVGLLQTEGAARQRNYALAGAEAGLDFARAKLKESLLTGIPAEIAPGDEQLSKDYGVPVQYLPQVGNRCRVMIRVTRIQGNDIDWALNHSSQTIPGSMNTRDRKPDAAWSFGDDWQLFAVPDSETAPNKSYCWKVEVTSYCGAFASSIRSILIGSSLVDGAPPPPAIPNAPAIVTNNNLDLDASGDRMIVQANTLSSAPEDQVFADSGFNSFKATLKSNGTFDLGSVALDGNLIGSNPSGVTSAFVNGEPSSLINGRIETNIAYDSANNEIPPTAGLKFKSGDTADPDDTVLASADLAPYGSETQRLAGNQEPVQRQSGVNQNLSQAPIMVSVPSNASPFPGFSTTPPDQTAPVPFLQTVPAGQSLVADSLDSSLAQSPLSFEADASNPTKIYVQDPLYTNPASPGYAIDLSSGMFRTGADANGLQLFYSGNRPVRLTLDSSNGAEMKLTLFAPNAAVTVQSANPNSNIGTFTGGIVGKSVTIHRLKNLRLDPLSAQTLSERLRTRGTSDDTESSVKPTDYKMVTWQQLHGAIVPLD